MREIGWVIAVLTVALFAFIYILMAISNRMEVDPQIARIEQLRRDVKKVDPSRAEDVVGQVTQWNQTIASNQAWNRKWWIDPVVSDKWEEVALIELED